MTARTDLTLEDFWALPEPEESGYYELIDGRAVPKVAAKFFHSFLQSALLVLIRQWAKGKGRIGTEWAVTLKRNGENWVPTPDLTYISYDRLPKSWKKNEACPVPCDLAIEIISPGESSAAGGSPSCRLWRTRKGQTRDDFAAKAGDYLQAGVLRVWVIDPEAVDITVYFPEGTSALYMGDRPIVDTLLPELELSVTQIFQEAELI